MIFKLIRGGKQQEQREKKWKEGKGEIKENFFNNKQERVLWKIKRKIRWQKEVEIFISDYNKYGWYKNFFIKKQGII